MGEEGRREPAHGVRTRRQRDDEKVVCIQLGTGDQVRIAPDHTGTDELPTKPARPPASPPPPPGSSPQGGESDARPARVATPPSPQASEINGPAAPQAKRVRMEEEAEADTQPLEPRKAMGDGANEEMPTVSEEVVLATLTPPAPVPPPPPGSGVMYAGPPADLPKDRYLEELLNWPLDFNDIRSYIMLESDIHWLADALRTARHYNREEKLYTLTTPPPSWPMHLTNDGEAMTKMLNTLEMSQSMSVRVELSREIAREMVAVGCTPEDEARFVLRHACVLASPK